MERGNLREVLRSRYPEGSPSSVEWLTAVSKKRVVIIGNDQEHMCLRKECGKEGKCVEWKYTSNVADNSFSL